MNFRVFCLLSLGAALGIACDDTAAVASVELTNETVSADTGANVDGGADGGDKKRANANPLISTPWRFALRLRRVYLAEGVDASQANTGKTTVVWQNVACTGGGQMGILDANDCPFVDLASKTELLKGEPVLAHAGDYHFVRLEICQSSPTKANIEWGGSAMKVAQPFTHEWCALTSAPIDPPIHLEIGQVASIAVAYDLTDAVELGPADAFPTQAQAGQFIDCKVDEGGYWKSCVRQPKITAKVR